MGTRARRATRWLLVPALAVVLTLGCLMFWPMKSKPLETAVRPVSDFASARDAILARIAGEPPEVRAEGRPVLLDHGHRTQEVYVLLHGLTNCPAQYREFARLLHARGSSVYIPRMPGHGYADRLTTAQTLLTAESMAAAGTEAVNLAAGLGERVVVVGLSVNGVTAAWLGQEREDVALAVSIAPFFAPKGLPGWAIAPLTHTVLRLPNVFLWWDPRQKEALAGSPYSYPRFATHTIGQAMLFGLDTFALAKAAPPAARKILVVTSPDDEAVSLPRIEQLLALWEPSGRAETRSFPREWNVRHDCIDPDQPGAMVDKVYPQLIAWIEEALGK